MTKNKLIYVFDTYCSWCYGMGPVLEKTRLEYKDILDFEVLSGGMIPEDTSVQELAKRFSNPKQSFNQVTAMTGQSINSEFIQMLEKPDEYEYTFNSVYPARALTTLKHFLPGREIEQAEAIQDLVYSDLLDITKTESYKTVVEDFGVDWVAFVHRFESDESLQDARYEFHLTRQLEVTSYPAVLMQTDDQYFYLLARGYTPFETLNERIQGLLKEKNEVNAKDNGQEMLS